MNNNLKLSKYTELEKKYSTSKFLSDILKRSITISTGKNEIDIRYLQRLLDLTAIYKPLQIFSTNYDICIERFCTTNSKRYFDGFDHEWNGDFGNREEDILLYKLHGSITWSRSERGKYTRNEIAIKEDIINPQTNIVTGEIEVPLILYPGKKLEYSEPVFDILLELKSCLDTVYYVFVVGYSFRDDHIRRLFQYGARNNPNLIMILITPEAYTIYRNKIEYYEDPEFQKNMNINFIDDNFLAPVPSEFNKRTVCLPYDFKKVLPFIKDKYLKNLSEGLKSENEGDWINCLKYYGKCEYLEKVEEVIEKIGWNNLISNSWNLAFESISKALLDSLYSGHDNQISIWKKQFQKICEPISIEKYHFQPKEQNNIELERFGNLTVQSVVDSLGNIISASQEKLIIANEDKVYRINEQISKIKSLKEYLQQWLGQMTYEKYNEMRSGQYAAESIPIQAFMTYDYRKMQTDDTYGEIGKLIKQIESRELERIYQNLFI